MPSATTSSPSDFEAGQLTRGQSDLRLVVHLELTFVEADGEIESGAVASPNDIVEVVVEELDPRSPGLLGRVHRGVGVPDELFGVDARTRDGDADAGADDQLLTSDAERGPQSLQQALGHRHRLDRTPGVLVTDEELVAAYSSHEVARRDQPLEVFRHRADDGVAGLATDPVVQRLEPVDVERENGSNGALAGTSSQRTLEVVDEQPAVRQRGQRVVHGREGDVGLQLSSIADVDGRADDPFEADLEIGDDLEGGVDRDDRTVRASSVVLALPPIPARHRTHHLLGLVASARSDVQVHDRPTLSLRCGVAVHGLGSVVPVHDHSSIVGDDDGRRKALEQSGLEAAADLETPTRRDVAAHDHDGTDALVVEHVDHGEIEIPPTATPVFGPNLDRLVLSRCFHRCNQRRLRSGDVERVEAGEAAGPHILFGAETEEVARLFRDVQHGARPVDQGEDRKRLVDDAGQTLAGAL